MWYVISSHLPSLDALPLFYLFLLFYCDQQNELLASVMSRDESVRDATLGHAGKENSKENTKEIQG